MPEHIRAWIDSWSRFEPTVEVLGWDAEDCGCRGFAYFDKAIGAGQWAFAADYARLRKLYEQGGIYLDTDIELHAPIVAELSKARLTLSFEKNCVQGCIIASESRHPFIGRLLDRYDSDVDVGDKTVEPKSIVTRITDLLIDEYGLRTCFGERVLAEGIRVVPANRFLVDMHDGQNLAEHHYAASWTKDFNAGAFVRDIKRYCAWTHAPLKFRLKERVKILLQFRFPRIYRMIRDRRR